MAEGFFIVNPLGDAAHSSIVPGEPGRVDCGWVEWVPEEMAKEGRQSSFFLFLNAVENHIPLLCNFVSKVLIGRLTSDYRLHNCNRIYRRTRLTGMVQDQVSLGGPD